MVLLGIWLIVWGAITLLALSFNGSEIIMAVVAIIAGILILMGR